MKPGSYYAEKVDTLPAGLTRVVGRVLEKAVGHRNGVTVERLVALVRLTPGLDDTDERQARASVEELRKGGMDIVNLMDGAGYFIPAQDEKELYLRFRNSYTSRAKAIFDTTAAMDATAKRKFGSLEENAQQPGFGF